MRAFLLTGHGGLDRHRFVTGWPIPEPGPKEVRVHACGLNTVDVNTRVGRYAREVQAPTQGEGFGVEVGAWCGRVRFPLIQGSDIVGVVDRVGEGADPRLLGRRVVDNWIRDPEEPSASLTIIGVTCGLGSSVWEFPGQRLRQTCRPCRPLGARD